MIPLDRRAKEGICLYPTLGNIPYYNVKVLLPYSYIYIYYNETATAS